MRRLLFPFFSVFFLVIFVVASCWAQAPAIATTATVPPLIKVSGTISSVNSGTVGVNFALYAEQTGGAPLWLETQNVALNANGRYTIYLGANHTNGVPMDLFASGEARWLGVQPEGQAEQARVMLVSVPYAMTAGDAQTLGGQPLSAFVLASAATGSTTTASSATTAAASGGVVALATPQTGGSVTTSAGATNYLSKFTATTGDIENSMIFDTSSGAGMGSYTPGFVGIGTTAPAATLHVVSTSTAAGFVDVYSNTLNAVTFATRAARGTPASPAVVQAGDIIGGFTGRGWTGPVSGSTGGFSGGRGALIIHANETWSTTAQSTYMQFNTTALGTNYQAERMRLDNAGNLGIGTSNPGGTPPSPLPAPVTLEVNGSFRLTAGSGGGVTFQDGTTQTTAFTGTNGGTYTNGAGLSLTGSQFGIAAGGVTNSMLANPSLTVTAGSGLTGGGAVALGGSTALGLDLTSVPLLGTSNNFTASQAITGDLTASGTVTSATVSAAGGFNLGGQPFAFGSFANYNAFLGFAGNSTTAGTYNTASGYQALASTTYGSANTASGLQALYSDSTGFYNTASGFQALYSNTTGSSNTGLGAGAGDTLDGSSITGSNNTAIGAYSYFDTGTLTNATAIGSNAIVGTSNALVLGSISGVNGATASVNVGIGTPSPAYTLDVHGTANFTGPVTFASGQTFPGAGGSVTSVGSGAGLTGGPVTTSGTLSIASEGVTNAMLAHHAVTVTAGTGLTGGGLVALGDSTTLNLDTTVVPQLSSANTFTGNQTVNGNLSATGTVTGSSFAIGSNLFAFGSYANANAFFGFAGNATTTGSSNTASGIAALSDNSTGSNNTASGYQALSNNTTGGSNTASGYDALFHNTTGDYNTGLGGWAGGTIDSSSITGSSNTAIGASSAFGTGTLTNATAIGANAEVAVSNAMVLGSINGVNGASANTNVGIGTTSPAYTLDVHGTGNFTGLVTFAAGQTFPIAPGGVPNAMLKNPSLTVTAGTGLTGGGLINLGGSATLNVDTTKVPMLGASNTFAGTQMITGDLDTDGNVISDYLGQNGGTIRPGLILGGAGEGISSNRTGSTNQYGIDFYTNSTNHMSITNSGKVGIGTASPTMAMLQVNGGSNGAIYGMGPSASSTGSEDKGLAIGVWGDTGASANANYGPAILGTADDNYAGLFVNNSSTTAQTLMATNLSSSSSAVAFIAGGYFLADNCLIDVGGNLVCGGDIVGSSKQFKIDHPLDPANKYLYHASVESSEMKNIYDGNVVLDANGEATVQLPDWFEAMNADFRYQLTPVGRPGPGTLLYVSQEISGNSFQIAGGSPGLKVSWQVTGVRQDAYAKAHPLVVEEAKSESERGKYIHPELYGAPKEQSIGWARHPHGKAKPSVTSVRTP